MPYKWSVLIWLTAAWVSRIIREDSSQANELYRNCCTIQESPHQLWKLWDKNCPRPSGQTRRLHLPPNTNYKPIHHPCISDLRILRDALVSGACHWVRLTAGEVTRHLADLASREAAGEKVTKKGKERSDKGAVKGPRRKPVVEDDECESDDTVAGPSKKRKAPAMISKATGKEKATAKGKTKAKGKKNWRSTKYRKSQLPSSNEFIVDTDDEDDLML